MKGSNLLILLKIGGYSPSYVSAGDVRIITFWDVTNDCIVETYDDTSNTNHKFWETLDNIDLYNETISIKGDFSFKKRKNPKPWDTPLLNADASFQLNKIEQTALNWEMAVELANKRPTMDVIYKSTKKAKANKTSKYVY